MTGGELIALLVLATGLGSSKSSSSAPPPPPPQPDAGGDDGGLKTEDIASTAGGAVGTLLTTLIGAFGGGGSTTGTTGAVVGTGTGVATASAGTGTAVSSGVGGAFATTVTAGGVFATAWAAFFVVQFIVINLVNNERVKYLRYKNSVRDMNMRPRAYLHLLEQQLVETTLLQLGLSPSKRDADDWRIEGSVTKAQDGGPGNDPRLDYDQVTAEAGQQVLTNYHHWRQIYENPFTGPDAAAKWWLLTMAARLVASRYVFELGKCARGMLTSFPGLGGHPTTQWGNDALDVWNYPLLSGGQPSLPYADLHRQLQQMQDPKFPIDDVLKAARLAAILQCASVVGQDPGVYFPWNSQLYAQWLYSSLGISEADDHISRFGERLVIDPAFYGFPCRELYIHVDNLKAGKRYAPFLPGLPAGVVVANPPTVTSLVAIV